MFVTTKSDLDWVDIAPSVEGFEQSQKPLGK